MITSILKTQQLLLEREYFLKAILINVCETFEKSQFSIRSSTYVHDLYIWNKPTMVHTSITMEVSMCFFLFCCVVIDMYQLSHYCIIFRALLVANLMFTNVFTWLV